MAVHQGVVRTAALIKRRSYWPRMQKDVEAWCKRCTTCGRCKAAIRGHGKLQQPRHGAFNERVWVDLIGPLHKTDRGNEYIVVMQDHFTKCIEGAAVATKEAMLVADVIVNEWVYKQYAWTETIRRLKNTGGTMRPTPDGDSVEKERNENLLDYL